MKHKRKIDWHSVAGWALAVYLIVLGHILSYGLAHHLEWHRWYWELLGVM